MAGFSNPDARRATILLLTYQHERFVAEALRSALAQECEPIDILVSDDASTDGTWAALMAVAASYDGPHRLVLRRNETNRYGTHLTSIMSLIRTPLVVLAHGDDIAEPHRVRRVLETWAQSGAALIGSNAMLVDEQGAELQPYHRGGVSPEDLTARACCTRSFQALFVGAALSFERRLLDGSTFQPIDHANVHGNLDIWLPARAALYSSVAYVDEPLVRYRWHAGQASRELLTIAGGNDAIRENLRANHIAAQLQILSDIRGLIAGGSADPRLRELRGAAHSWLVSLAVDWNRSRVKLGQAKLLPSWG